MNRKSMLALSRAGFCALALGAGYATGGAGAPDPAPGLDRRAPDLVARAPEEWQGMRVDRRFLQAECESTEHCGVGMACIAGACAPCEADGDCLQGEACVLDHCLVAENVGCTTVADCEGDALCVLSGDSPGVRGNADTTSRCLSPESPSAEPVHRPSRPGVRVPRAEVDVGTLLSSLRTAR